MIALSIQGFTMSFISLFIFSQLVSVVVSITASTPFSEGTCCSYDSSFPSGGYSTIILNSPTNCWNACKTSGRNYFVLHKRLFRIVRCDFVCL